MEQIGNCEIEKYNLITNEAKENNSNPYLVFDTVEDIIRQNIINLRQIDKKRLKQNHETKSILKNERSKNSMKYKVKFNMDKNKTNIVSRWIIKSIHQHTRQKRRFICL